MTEARTLRHVGSKQMLRPVGVEWRGDGSEDTSVSWDEADASTSWVCAGGVNYPLGANIGGSPQKCGDSPRKKDVIPQVSVLC